MSEKVVSRKSDIVAFWILSVALLIRVIGMIMTATSFVSLEYSKEVIVNDITRQVINTVPWIVLLFHLKYHSRMKKDILLIIVFVWELFRYVRNGIIEFKGLYGLSEFLDDRSVRMDLTYSGRYYLMIAQAFLMALMCLFILINTFCKNNEKRRAKIPFYVFMAVKIIWLLLLCHTVNMQIVLEKGNNSTEYYGAMIVCYIALLFFDVANIIHISGRRREKLKKEDMKKKEFSIEEELILIKNQYESGSLSEQEYRDKKAELIKRL